MAAEKDRFDRLPRTRGRVGAHRGPRRRGWGWFWLLIALIAIAAIVFGALRVLHVTMGIEVPWLGISTPSASSTETSAPSMIDDPADIDPSRGITIVVLNGTPLSGLQDTVYDGLQADGWPVTSKGNAGERDQPTTVVYYSNPADIDVARGLVSVLGVGDVQSVDAGQYPGASITIVIGEDSPLYAQAVEATSDATDAP